MTLVAVTGGIGSGKSVVCSVLRACGFLVYDCDSRAKAIMDSEAGIWNALCSHIHPNAVVNGKVDRPLISSVVFADPDKLARLNSIVHGAVERDLKCWCERHSDHELLFVETAILYQSDLNRIVDEVWEVTAPEYIRIERVMNRNGLSREAVVARIEAQNYGIPADAIRPPTFTIVNDNHAPILPAIEKLLAK